MSAHNKTQMETFYLLCNMSGEQVTNAITDFLGMQILTDEFAQHLIDEGLASESDFSELD